MNFRCKFFSIFLLIQDKKKAKKEKFSILFCQVLILLGIASGNAFAIKIKSAKDAIPTPKIYPKYLMGYPPMKVTTRIIENPSHCFKKVPSFMIDHFDLSYTHTS